MKIIIDDIINLAPAPDWIIAMVIGEELRSGNNPIDVQAEYILQGSRNQTLWLLACRKQWDGLSEEAIFASISSVNKLSCQPPLDEDELRDIAHRAAKYNTEQINDKSESHSLQLVETGGFYTSLAEMLADDIPEEEEIVFGIGRGEVGMLVSVTNVGKTTLMLNLGLSLAAGEIYLPLVPNAPRPYRVLYCDFESPRHKLKRYIEKMLPSIRNRETAMINFIPLPDAFLKGEQLNLSHLAHLEFLTEHAKKSRADLVIIDPVTAAFDLTDENSNAEVARRIIKPLKRMAYEVNAGIFFAHHSGKPSEFPSSEKAYAGRGASSFGGLSRASFLLTRDRQKGDDYVVLECGKIKGEKFLPLLLKLNHDTGWFERCVATPNVERNLSVQEIAKFVESKGQAKRKEITENFKDRASGETIDRRLADAVKWDLIIKPKQGVFQSKGIGLPKKKDD